MIETVECEYKCNKDVKFQTTTPVNNSILDKDLLQKRLKAVSFVMFFGVAIFYIRGLYAQDQPMGQQLVTLCLLAVSTGVLMIRPFSLRFLRMMEVFVFGSMVLLLIAKYFSVIIAMGNKGDFAAVTLNQVYLCSGLVNIIVVYGLFLPNNWRRTLVFVAVTASGYFVTAIWVNFSHNSLDLVNLWTVTYFLFGAIISCSGSYVIYSLRKEVLDAKNVGRYKLIDKLASGGMGEVWHAEHQMLARPAAVKLVRPDVNETSEDAVVRFEREAEAIAKLDSPHTVQIYDFGITNSGDFYYAMELLKGLDLDDFVDKYGHFPIARGVYVLQQICKSLMEAHNKGLVHRDIKPGNIFLSRRGCEYDFVKVLDFGMVKRDWDSQKITQENVINGTPTFIAPEMIHREKGDIDARTDIYLLGCVAYWIFTGRFVFFKDNILATVLAHASSEPKRICEFIEDFPEELDDLVMRCLEKEPENRPASVKDVYVGLEKLGYAREWNQVLAEEWWRANILGAESTTYWQ
ncbi:serine/threonine protein kinase [Candidatus Uabimicrobium amorphum]|uniref:Serine/threonine protein kinase n=1 Tax=Uabimicrobium amorphum TaxID=2596890 RepID=A0A5S9IT35_UABAM|nr:serine/threonine-protein kinase [Candidatus Uabimicrobium amorphum]BBM87237.1 serine/threonine protein kinase [Candidatus Uabimicrobium amorphum]